MAGSQVAGVVGAGAHAVQMQGFADCGGDCSLSGDALVSNLLEAAAGPSAEGEAAQVSQIGDNDAVISQSGDVETGDGLSGAQVTGVVGGKATVQNSNTSRCAGDTCAASGVAGDANLPTNEAALRAGPLAAGGDAAAASQTGDDSAQAEQSSDASSGDAASGSQVTGLVSEERGHLRIQNHQASEGDFAKTQNAFASNDLEAASGPASEGGAFAEVSQTGDDTVDIDQTTGAIGGDALAASQITGAVAGEGSTVTVQNSNSAGAALDPGATALSGNAVAASQVTGVVTGAGSATTIGLSNAAVGEVPTGALADSSAATNAADATAGPMAEADDAAQVSQTGDDSMELSQTGNDAATARVVVGPAADADAASAAQRGDDALDASQHNESASGDAVAGSQVTGAVSGPGSRAAIQASGTAAEPFATSGVDQGPVIAIPNVLEAAVGPSAAGGDRAQAAQSGDASATISQSADASSGDAVSGSQVTGAVVEAATVQPQGFAEMPEAVSGVVDATNTVAGTLGPSAEADVANASQSGSSAFDLSQGISSEAGDAVAAAQVSGGVGRT